MAYYTVSRRSNDNDYYIVFEGSDPTTYELPSARIAPGISFVFKNQSTAAVTLACVGEETVDGETSFELTNQFDEVSLFSDGNDWNIDASSSASDGGSGTVTSVGLLLPSMFTISNSPVTSSGTLTASLASQVAKTVLAAPNAGNGAPSFRQLQASDITGLPTVPTAANPSATVGTAVANGSATTFMRSDAAPALNLAITPTWTAAHTFSVSPIVPTPTTGDNTTKAASTAFVQTAVAAGSGSPQDIAVPWSGTSVLANSQVLAKYIFPRATNIAAGAGLSKFSADAASSATTVLVIAKNGTQCGTVTYSTSATGVVNFTAATSFAAGDVLTVTGPATADTTLKGVFGTIAATI